MEVGFKSEYFEKLASLEKENFWFKMRNKIIIWAIRAYSHDFDNMLEIGCGTGFVSLAISDNFPNTKLTGSEIFEEGLDYARSRVKGGKFIKLDARSMTYESDFSIIGAFDVLEHIDEDELVLRNINKSLKPGGVLFLTVPQHDWLWSQADEYACHVRRYSAVELARKLHGAGFKVKRSTSFMTLLLPIMWMSRSCRKKTSTSRYDIADELSIHPVLNKIFELMMFLDYLLVRMGINLPVGGSRLVVAEKAK